MNWNIGKMRVLCKSIPFATSGLSPIDVKEDQSEGRICNSPLVGLY